jgi:hypothetical protein
MRSIFLVSLFVAAFLTVHAQQDFQILQSTSQKVVISYTPKYVDTTFKTIEGNKYRTVNILHGIFHNADKTGYPQIPSRDFDIGVPNVAGNQIHIRSISTVEISGSLLPFPKYVKDLNEKQQIYAKGSIYSPNTTYPANSVYEYSSGSIRNLPVLTVAVNAARFNPVTSKIEIVTKIEFEVVFSTTGRTTSKVTDSFLNDVVVNSDMAKNFVATENFKKQAVSSSVLASGKWVRFQAPDEGIYMITKSMLSSLGIPDSVDPRTIKIYNNGGQVLPTTVTASRPVDLVENAIYVSNQSTGVFSSTDTILFYGRGVNFWNYNATTKTIERCSSPYSDENYYWLTYGGAAGKRMSLQASLSTSNAVVDTTTAGFAYWEKDEINIGNSGRQFLGDAFTETNKSRLYTKVLEGILSGSTINYFYRFVNASPSSVQFGITESDNSLVSKFIGGTGSNSYSYGVADTGSLKYTGTLTNNTSNLRFTYNSTGTSINGYLDYYEIRYNRDLKAASDFLTIWSPAAASTYEYRLTGFTNNSIWAFDVSDYSNVKLISNPQRLNGGELRFQAAKTSDTLNKFIACTPFQFKTPSDIKAVSNEDLRGISTGGKLIIIAPTEFIAQANRLKSHRENSTAIPMPTVVADINQIYNEFSSGNRDVSAVRDFIRYAYLNWSITPEYVLFLGHGDYDYKNIEGTGINFIPPFETVESLDEIDSYNTDDYFARVDGDDDYIDLAIGRLPVQSAAEATIAVNKIIEYETSSDKSLWRNKITLVADDSYTSSGQTDGSTHTDQSETISIYYVPPAFDQNKIYLAAYPTEYTSFGRRKPKVNEAIVRAAMEGTLIMNYVGHGSPDLWAHEEVFVKDAMIPEFTNSNLFFLTAATCDFGYFDRTSGQSGAEMLVLKETGGAIGAFTATRPVYSTLSASLNNEFYDNMFNVARDTFNLPIPIGKSYFLAKKSKDDANDQKYHLFCDPSLRLNLPQYSAQVDSVNGLIPNSDIQVSALGKVKINGSILSSSSSASKFTGYTGKGIVTVYDSKQKMPIPEFGSDYTVDIQGGVIYKGLVSIGSGAFQTDFVVPKDISYENKNGKIVIYYYNDANDGLGYSKRIVVGGTDTTTIDDKKGPEISIKFDNENSDGSYLIRPNSTLIVKLSDETGLNTTGSGVGRRLQGVLNQDESNILDFTNYYVGDLNTGGKSGTINYQFSDMAEGEYRIDVKAWDVFNNASTATAYFKVVSGDDLVIDYIYNYPNPFSSQTTFLFYHNYSEPVDVKIKIYTVAGRLVQQIEKNGISERNVKIAWDGRDKDNDLCGSGVYLYKLMVSPTNGKAGKSYIGKLAIIRK